MCDMFCLQGGLGEEGPMGKSGRNGNKVIASGSSFHGFYLLNIYPFGEAFESGFASKNISQYYCKKVYY